MADMGAWKNQLNTSDSSSVPTSLASIGTLHDINNHHDQTGSNQQHEQETVDIPIQNSSPTIGDAESITSTLLSRFMPVAGSSQDRDRIVSLDCASEEINELYTGHLKPPSEVVDDFGLVNTMDICESDMENDSSGESIESASMDSDSDHEDNINSESQTFQSPPFFVLPPSSEVFKSDITYYEHMVAVNALATSGNLSSLVFQNLLDLIKLHVPDKSLCEGNVNDLKKKLGFNKDYLQNFEYCSICGSTFPDDGNDVNSYKKMAVEGGFLDKNNTNITLTFNTERDQERISKNIEEAVLSDKTVKGFNGRCAIRCLPGFSPANNIVIDYMHACLAGITKRLIKLFTDGTSFKEDYFIGHKVPLIDKQLKCLRVPYLINRKPRPLSLYLKWKSSEFRSWMLYYSIPCLINHLPEVYLQHYSCLVEGIHILLQSNVTEEDITLSETLLNAFYKHASELYGENFVGLNVHNLSHLPDCVRKWGPLWAYSCFGFESANGELLKKYSW
ncbi:uncharacterized protein LOC110456660 [Mizuhopecten yessoensis]|uniref:uncharacterized protein LOC110456660 n=1 Tax=Mizuhopecten yessoensis TaxID=6573 RepID=UPI000B45C7D0|nr:uncharacterized protein LOC110456660 [Mizuhopecten yessoensis]